MGTTKIAKTTRDTIVIRGKDLCADLIGERTFTETLYFLITGRLPTANETRILDACLVTLMEHGWTPSSIIARLTADSVPGEIQVAISSGLLAIGSVFAGTAENCAEILRSAVAQQDPLDVYFDKLIVEYRGAKKPIPGFGHPIHRPKDPRAVKLIKIGRELQLGGQYLDALELLSARIDKFAGKPITLNVTGAIAASLLEISIPPEIMRGVSVVSRAGGLIGHILEEQTTHAAREIWDLTEKHNPYQE